MASYTVWTWKYLFLFIVVAICVMYKKAHTHPHTHTQWLCRFKNSKVPCFVVGLSGLLAHVCGVCVLCDYASWFVFVFTHIRWGLSARSILSCIKTCVCVLYVGTLKMQTHVAFENGILIKFKCHHHFTQAFIYSLRAVLIVVTPQFIIEYEERGLRGLLNSVRRRSGFPPS